LAQATLCSTVTQLPPEKGHTPTQFWSMYVVDKRLDDQDATSCEGTCLNFLNQTFGVYRK